MGAIWSKVWRDLVHNKARTVLVVLSTAVGVFALGLTFGLSGVMSERMTATHRETITAHIIFSGGPFTQETVDAIRREPGVLDTQGEIDTSIRWKLPGEDEWRRADLIARADYEAQRMELLRLLDGRWPEERVLGAERLAAAYYGVEPGSTILVEFGQREREVKIEGIVRLHKVYPPQWGGEATFFATPDAADWLVGYDLDYTRLQVRLESFSQGAAEEAAEQIKDRLERMGLHVGHYSITDPDVHWQQEMVDGSLLILATLGFLSLGLSAFMIINTMNAIIAQQIWQIGVMKAVGATFGQLIRVYLATALSYGMLALLLAVPLGAAAAHLMAIWLLGLFNITLDTFQVSVPAVVLQIVVGASVPLVSALVPVVGGARTTAHKAISTHGIGSGFGDSWIDRLFGRIRRLPRPMALSLRNTFRHKARVALTLLTLTLGGVIFTMTMSANDSFYNTIEILFDQLGEDISLYFDRPYHVSRIIDVAESVDGVQKAEVWNGGWAMLPLASGEEAPVYLRGVPADSTMFRPRLVAGRNLVPGDDRAVLVNSRLAVDEGIQVGDEITLKIGEEEAV
jgi:putative ABC transport system permease protein